MRGAGRHFTRPGSVASNPDGTFLLVGLPAPAPSGANALGAALSLTPFGAVLRMAAVEHAHRRWDRISLMGSVAPYDQLATEYYSAEHRTSRNFDDATKDALKSLGWTVPPGLLLEPGCGRGRCSEFLGLEWRAVVQLDNSAAMLALEPRERALLRVLHDAEELPFAAGEFACVAAFLCDTFLGLNFLAEARRVLSSGGLLLGTTPSHEWGIALRDAIGLDHMTTRFSLRSGEQVLVPSSLFPADELREMLVEAGYDRTTIQVEAHTLPVESVPVSPDIEIAARALDCTLHDLPVLYTFSARR